MTFTATEYDFSIFRRRIQACDRRPRRLRSFRGPSDDGTSRVLPRFALAATVTSSRRDVRRQAILIEASLSFLGLGTQPPNPSWGLMLSSTGRAFMEQAPWLAIFPGLAISLAVLGFNLFGDTLRDIWDPKLRGRS